MVIDQTAIAYGLVGLAAGAGVHFWGRKAELEERCEFLSEMGQDLRDSFDAVDEILENRSTPKPVRSAILVLLSAHTDNNLGKEMALTFTRNKLRDEDENADGSDPLSQAMENLGRLNPTLARKTHHVLASLMFGLVFLNLADNIKVARVKDAAAKDPTTLWARIARMFSNKHDNDHHQGGLVTV